MYNKQFIVGRLGQEPELKYTKDNTAICPFSVATSKKYKNKQGELVESTTWHNVVFFGKVAEVCGKYLSKGSLVFIEGEPFDEEYEDKNGNKRKSHKVKGLTLTMLDSKGSNSESGNSISQSKEVVLDKGFDDMNDDLPF
jgi:single-strand DNA-binding protein